MDGGIATGLARQCSAYLRGSRRTLSDSSDTMRRTTRSFCIWLASSLLDFRGRLDVQPDLGLLLDDGRQNVPARPCTSWSHGDWAFLRGLPGDHRERRQVHLRSLVFAGELAFQFRFVSG